MKYTYSIIWYTGKDSNKYEVETSEISDLSIFNTDGLSLNKNSCNQKYFHKKVYLLLL